MGRVSQTAAESNVQLIVMCDPTEGQSNEVQETTEPTPAPVESEAPEGAQKEQAGAEEQKETSKSETEQRKETPQSETEEQKETSQSETEEQKETSQSEKEQQKETSQSEKEEQKDESKKSESSTTCLTNESNSGESDIEDANRKTAKTVAGILARVKNDTEMTDMEKIDTLCLLLSKFVEVNGVLKNEIGIMLEQIKKHVAAKETLKAMNEAYKRQVDLVKEECELRLKEEQTKRQDNMGDYSATMDELSGLLETQSGQNSKLLTDNTQMSEQMNKLIMETQKREEQFGRLQTEYSLQITLYEAQLKKAQLEKAEVKCEMTQERIDIAKELETERDRSANLERTVTNLREQLDIYEKQSTELTQGVGNNAKQFQYFKTQIDKLTSTMTTLEKETSQWREKSELSAKQVQKMNQLTMEKDKDLTSLKKKLEGMVKLNQALTTERSELMTKVKKLDVGENAA